MTDVKWVHRDPVKDARQVAAIETAVQQGNIAGAVEMARGALDQGLVHPMLLNLRAYWHSDAGRADDALSDLRTAFAIAPQDIYVRNAFGLALVQAGHLQEAGPILADTAAMAPGYAPGQYSLGWFHAMTGNLDAARKGFEAAIAVDPEMPEALGHLASLAGDQADWPAAERFAARALAVSPNHPVALTALATSSLAQKDLDAAEASLARLGDFSQLPPLESIRARTVLGDLRDAQGRHADAFETYAARNRETFRRNAPQFDLVGATSTDHARGLKNFFDTLPDDAWAGTPDTAAARGDASGHVFLVGFPRSGTTLAENALAGHPDIVALDECDTLGAAAQDYLLDEAGWARLAAASQDELERHRALYWERVRGFGADVAGKVLLDKYPLSSIKLPLVAKLFPGARILFAQRDPRDVVFSCFRRSFALNPAMFEFLDLQRAAQFYDAVMALSAIYRRVLGISWQTLRYESLVADFDGEMTRICAFINLPFDDRIRNFAEAAKSRAIRTPSSAQVSRGLYREGAGQWRAYARELAPVLPILEKWVTAFDYDSSEA